MSITWDLLWVKVNGESVQGRPIEWDRVAVDSMGNDDTGEPLRPTKYMTTCPKCAQLLTFGPNDVRNDVVVCLVCRPATKEVKSVVVAEVAVAAQSVDSPFVDPVVLKLVPLDNYES